MPVFLCNRRATGRNLRETQCSTGSFRKPCFLAVHETNWRTFTRRNDLLKKLELIGLSLLEIFESCRSRELRG
jgi:hypothetical protein